MRARVKRTARRRWDYCDLLGLVAISLALAVIFGIIFTYVDVRQPEATGGSTRAHVSEPRGQQLPYDL